MRNVVLDGVNIGLPLRFTPSSVSRAASLLFRFDVGVLRTDFLMTEIYGKLSELHAEPEENVLFMVGGISCKSRSVYDRFLTDEWEESSYSDTRDQP